MAVKVRCADAAAMADMSPEGSTDLLNQLRHAGTIRIAEGWCLYMADRESKLETTKHMAGKDEHGVMQLQW